jgi:predicted dehydrogenase
MSYQRDFPRRLNVAVIGAGSHGYRNILPAMTYLPVSLRAICDINATLARATAEQYGAVAYAVTSEMYRNESLDAVFLSVSPGLHPQLAIEAFEAGINVWTEKPPALRAAGVRQMIEARKHRVAVVGFKKAFMPATEKAIELLRMPTVVPLRSLLAEYPMSIPGNGPEVLANGTVTNWLSNGVHPVSMLLAVGGKVNALTVHRASHGGGAVVLEFASGALGTFHMADGAPSYNARERYSFWGNGIQVEVENVRRVTLHRGVPFNYGATTTFAPPGIDHGSIVWEPQNNLGTLENKALFIQGFYQSLRYFCDCILESRSAERGSLEFARDVMNVYEAALLSNGKRIEL